MGYNNVNVNVSGPKKDYTSTYKTYILRGNMSFADQVTEPNVKYVVKYDFDLDGGTAAIPEGCLLEFDGGSVSNGTIEFDNTILIYNQQEEDVLKNITMVGNYEVSAGGKGDKKDNINGMGKIYLKKNRGFAEQLTQDNTIYVIQYDFDLGEESVTIPENCVLEFDGGSIANGKILNSNIRIDATKYNIFKNVYFFDTLSGFELLNDGVSVRVTQNDVLFNALTKKKAVVNDIVNISLLYRISNPATPTESDGVRSVVVNGTTYTVGDSEEGYSYDSSNIVGINEVTNEMLVGEVLGNISNEKFYRIQKLTFNSKSIVQNNEVYPEWFKTPEHADDYLSISAALILSSYNGIKVVLAEKTYIINKTINLIYGAKLIGTMSHSNKGSVIDVNCGVGILLYDLDCRDILIDGLHITTTNADYDKNYIGIEVQCSYSTVSILNCIIRRADTAINIYAYGVVQLMHIENAHFQTCNNGVYCNAIFSKRQYTYVNGIRIHIIEAMTVQVYTVQLIKCVGITIASSYSEINGTISVFCDGSMAQIEGITWNETNGFIKAINKSFVRVLGDPLAYGAMDKDSTSVILCEDITYRNLSPIKTNVSINNLLLSSILFDFSNRRYVDNYGKQLFKTPIDAVVNYDGIMYFNGSVENIPTSTINLDNTTIAIRCRCAGAGSVDLGFARFSAIVSSEKESMLVLKDSSNNTCDYISKGESIIYIKVKDGKYWISDSYVIDLLNEGTFDRIITTTDKLVISDIIIANKIIENKRDVVAIKDLLLTLNDCSKFKNKNVDYIYGEKELCKPLQNINSSDYNIYKIDIYNSCITDKNGLFIANIPNTVVKKTINNHNYITRAFNSSTNIIFNTPINIVGKSVIIRFATIKKVTTEDVISLGFAPISGGYDANNNSIMMGYVNSTTKRTAMELRNINGEHFIGLKCYVENEQTVVKCINRTANTFILNSGNTGEIKTLYVYTSQVDPKIFVSDFIVIDKLIEDEDEFLYYQDVLRESTITNRIKKESGSTRPTNPVIGDCFFDENIQIPRPIWYKGNNVWVDATGATI